ncbi:MAG: very short patch repair endonuclease [Proteobacteria bacterium]|nr:very short patch repair endonuclease [Pseudomonadota bacterium]
MTSELRSRIMRAVKGRDTGPERAVRILAHGMGYRYRLHRADLPGKPDLVFPSRRAVIFVNGCFWHGHDCPRGARAPKTNRAYWTAKIARNVARDATSLSQLKAAGWRALTVWECQIKDGRKLCARLSHFLR